MNGTHCTLTFRISLLVNDPKIWTHNKLNRICCKLYCVRYETEHDIHTLTSIDVHTLTYTHTHAHSHTHPHMHTHTHVHTLTYTPTLNPLTHTLTHMYSRQYSSTTHQPTCAVSANIWHPTATAHGSPARSAGITKQATTCALIVVVVVVSFIIICSLHTYVCMYVCRKSGWRMSTSGGCVRQDIVQRAN